MNRIQTQFADIFQYGGDAWKTEPHLEHHAGEAKKNTISSKTEYLCQKKPWSTSSLIWYDVFTVTRQMILTEHITKKDFCLAWCCC